MLQFVPLTFQVVSMGTHQGNLETGKIQSIMRQKRVYWDVQPYQALPVLSLLYILHAITVVFSIVLLLVIRAVALTVILCP